MKRIKPFIIGAGVALFNIGATFTQVFRPERCTGSCGSCGFSCAETAVGLVGIGVIAVLWKKIKVKIQKLKTEIKFRKSKTL